MLGAFVRAFRTPDLRRKLLFTIAIMVVFRVGSFLPTPGVSYPNVQTCVAQTKANDLLGIVNLFSGGALLQLSVFSLGIMPYITASIIIQLLRVVIPKFEELHKEGQAGTSKLTASAEVMSLGGTIVTIGTAASIGTATIANSMIATVTTSLTNVTAALARLGTKSKAFETHLTFVSKLQDTLEVGVGNLVDADLAKESAKFQALQTKQQLGVQALSIANQSSQSILSLFR